MEIRLSHPNEINEIMDVYAYARKFMEEHENPSQWGTTKPTQEQIEKDIREKKHYVCVCDGQIAAVFYFAKGTDPSYETIYDGDWLNDEDYAVVHRIASSGIRKGAGSFCIQWTASQAQNVRIDTHEDNYVMQNMLKKNGFVPCGIVFTEDGEQRIAFHKVCRKMGEDR